MQKQRRYILSTIFMVIVVCYFSACTSKTIVQPFPKAQKGVMDLSHWDFKKNGSVLLKGEWEFYWEKLISPDQLKKNKDLPFYYINTPGSWNKFEIDGKKLSGIGFATYRLKVITTEKTLGLKTLHMSSSSRVYVNGELICKSGFPASSKEQTIPVYAPAVTALENNSGVLDIIIHVSNFHHWKGGIRENVYLGKVSRLHAKREKKLFFSSLFFGATWMIGFYHIILFLIRKKDYSSLSFGLFCLVEGFQTIILGEQYFITIFPTIEFWLIVKLIYLTMYCAVPLFFWYMKTIFPNEMSDYFFKGVLFIGSLFSAFVLFFPSSWFTMSLPFFRIFTICLAFYGTLVLAKAIKNKRQGAKIFITGFVILLATVVNDMLFNGILIPFGLFLFLFTQAFLIAQKYSLAFSTIKQQGEALTIENNQRKVIEHNLKKSEKQYRTLFEKTNDAIFIVDKDTGRYLDANKAAEELTGHKINELKQLTTNEVAPENANQRLQTIAENSENNDLGTVTYLRPDNTSRIARLSTVPLGDNAVIGIARDITHDLEIERQLRQSQKMESIGTLAGGIAHDFNNILFPIIGHTEMVLMDTPEDSPVRNTINEIYTSALRAKELVKQILTFSRQEDSELTLIKMQPIIKDALKLIRSTIPTTIEIQQDINPNCGVIKADPTQIHQIVMNLTTNAYHAMEGTGGELKVSLKEVELGESDIIAPNVIPGNYACLTVADTGVGMDKNIIDKIFDPFFTTKEIGKGTGMGLSVVHGIVRNMNGEIQVNSEPEKGTQFHVYHPLAAVVKEQQATNLEAPIQGGTERILLVDDEESVLHIERVVLEHLGYQVFSCSSGLEALNVFRQNPDNFDLVITDMAMPNMSGDKLSVELIKIRPNIPALLCTGFSESISEEKAVSLGIKGFLLKPIIIKDLAQKIREVLDEAGA